LLGNGSVNTFPRKRKRAQRCGKHISSAVNQRATIEEAVFSVGAAPRLYNKDLTHLELGLSSGVGSWRNNDKKGIRLCKKYFMCAAVTVRML
jgi:hypothetical protein